MTQNDAIPWRGIYTYIAHTPTRPDNIKSPELIQLIMVATWHNTVCDDAYSHTFLATQRRFEEAGIVYDVKPDHDPSLTFYHA